MVHHHAGNLKDYRDGILAKIKILTGEQLRQLTYEFETMSLPAAYSYDILVMEPSNRQRDRPIIGFASRFIGNAVLAAIEVTDEAKSQRLCKTWVGSNSTSSMAGMILDAWIHSIFTKGGRWPLTAIQHSIKKRRKNNVWSSLEVDIDVDNTANQDAKKYLIIGPYESGVLGPLSPITSSGPLPPSACRIYKAVEMLKPLKYGYYKPKDRNQATFGGFIYSPETEHAILFQAAVSQKHVASPIGFDQLTLLGVKDFTYILVTPPQAFVQVFLSPDLDSRISERHYLVLDKIVPRIMAQHTFSNPSPSPRGFQGRRAAV